jgi:predicted homoserine dehydrogenase-like protein
VREVADESDLVPFELLSDAKVTNRIETDQLISAMDVDLDTDSPLYHLRQVQNQLL